MDKLKRNILLYLFKRAIMFFASYIIELIGNSHNISFQMKNFITI